MCPHMDVCYIFLNNTIIFFSTKLKQSFWGSVKRINHTGSDIICQIFAFKMLKNWQTGTRNPHKLVKVKKIACRLVCTSLPVTMTLVLKNCKLWTFMWNKFELSIWFRIGIKKKLSFIYTHKMFKKKLCTYSFTSTKMSSWATYDHTSTLACCNFILLTRTAFVCFMTSKNLHIKNILYTQLQPLLKMETSLLKISDTFCTYRLSQRLEDDILTVFLSILCAFSEEWEQ